MSSDFEPDDDLPEGLEDDDTSGPYLAIVEVCIETPEGKVAENLCVEVECDFDHAPTRQEVQDCALDESQDWLTNFQQFDYFTQRFGNNPTIVIGNIIIQRNT